MYKTQRLHEAFSYKIGIPLKHSTHNFPLKPCRFHLSSKLHPKSLQLKVQTSKQNFKSQSFQLHSLTGNSKAPSNEPQIPQKHKKSSAKFQARNFKATKHAF
jgi:hypothetical protein